MVSITFELDIPPVPSGAAAAAPIDVTYAPDSPGPAIDRSASQPALVASEAPGNPHAEADGTVTQVSVTSIALRPFDDCDPGVACDRTIILRVAWRSPRADRAITGSWSIDAVAPLPRPVGATQPPGVELTIDVQSRGGPPA